MAFSVKTALIVIGIAAVLALVLAILIRFRTVPTHSASAADIPNIVEQLHNGRETPRYAVLMFGPTESENDTVNLQFSVEDGRLGLDWVLLAPRNIADKDRVVEFAERRGHLLAERKKNGVRYLRSEGEGVADLGIAIITTFYRISPGEPLGLIAEGFTWPPPGRREKAL